jgi:Mg2+ and Co2+ transporter CorA
MKVRSFRLASGRLREQPGHVSCPREHSRGSTEQWFDVAEASAEDLREFLAPLALPSSVLERCLDRVSDPGILTAGPSILMEYPAAFDRESDKPAFLTIIVHEGLLVTVRHGHVPALDEIMGELASDTTSDLSHLAQVVYFVLDEFADLNVLAQTALRNQIQALATVAAESPVSVKADSLSRLRWEVGNLVALIEDQLYCISGLRASDSEALRDPRREAFLVDLMSETEIAQRGIYRLETRVNDLSRDYQAVASDRVDKRLRVLTIVSAITLPLGLVTGLLGMNVGGVPGTSVWYGFLVVVVIMFVLFLIEFWYLKRKGWFD